MLMRTNSSGVIAVTTMVREHMPDNMGTTDGMVTFWSAARDLALSLGFLSFLQLFTFLNLMISVNDSFKYS